MEAVRELTKVGFESRARKSSNVLEGMNDVLGDLGGWFLLLDIEG